MKKTKLLFMILVCVTFCTSTAYAQNNKFSQSRTGSFSSSSSSKTSSSSSKTSSSSSKTSSSSSKTSSSSSMKTSTSQSRPSSYSSQRTSNSYSNSSSSASKASRSNSTYSSSRSTTTPSRQQNTSSHFSNSQSGSKADSSPAERATKSTAKTHTATANITHSRERMVQRTRALTKTPSGSTTPAYGTQRTASSASTASAAIHSAKASNFVYSPQKNVVMKMHPSSAKPKSSARQMTHSGLWSQCRNNWSGTQTTNKSMVQTYAKQNLNMELVDYGFSGGILYVIAEDRKGTFLQACNQEGQVLDEQEIIRGYKTIVTTEENSGVWIVKKNNADPLYYSFDGTHLTMYVAEEGKDIIDYNFCEMVTYTITRENQHTYFQIYNDTDQQPLASTEIDGDFNTIDVEASECRCYIKDPDSNQSAEMIWLGDEIMMVEGDL